MASFRFIHTADIHLDSPLKGLSGQEGDAAERIRTATRKAFADLVDQALREEVAFVIISGDLYDGDWRDYQTGLYFIKQTARLAATEVPVILLYGNHDAESQITRRLILPSNVKVFSARKPETIQLTEHEVALHGQSYRHRDIEDNLVRAYPEPIVGKFNIGVLHTALGGMGGHANYAPCTLDELVNKGYDYWALGHVHQSTILNEQPHVIFPGNLQGRHIRETGPKGAYLVTVEDNEITEAFSVPCDVVRWTHMLVSVEGCKRMTEAVDRIQDAIVKAVATEADGRLLACRIELTGPSEIHSILLASTEQLLADVRGTALEIGEETVWIERIVIETRPVLDSATLRTREDALGELQRMLEYVSKDTALLQQLKDDIGELVRKLPHELRADTEDTVLKAAIDGDYVSLIRDVSSYLAARITTEEQ